MPQDYFNQRKKALLSKEDKSSIGEWDKKIKKLCDKINKSSKYYTTSSCSGRILVMVDQEKKSKGLFKFVSHDLVKFNDFMKEFNNLDKKLNLKFKSEPMILHVACKDLDAAKDLMKVAYEVGFKKTGLIALDKRIIVEINGSEKIEFPLTKSGDVLVSEDFLKIVLDKANNNLKKNWKKIKDFEDLI